MKKITSIESKRKEKERKEKQARIAEHNRMYSEIARGATVHAREQAVVDSLRRRGLIT